MVCLILCDFVWFIIVYYANICPCKVSNGLVWLCMFLCVQLFTIFVLVECTKGCIAIKIVLHLQHFMKRYKNIKCLAVG